jgi:MOSC domain-containing protein YiiM
MVKRFQQSGRSGFYLAVLREGEIGSGDAIERLTPARGDLTVADVVRLYAVDEANQALLARASEHPGLPATWRDYFRTRLWEPDA